MAIRALGLILKEVMKHKLGSSKTGLFIGSSNSQSLQSTVIEEKNLRTVDVIRSHGYKAEEYSVVTEDGYILALTRIKSAATKLPVLMMHGVIAASDQWVLRGPKQDLAFILADEGHEVWLGDQRGNVYSHNHTSLNISDPKFWDYSFHETGLYDLPALIETVLKHSKTNQLHYIGHSMGTSDFYVMGSLRPQYNKYVRSAVHLSPVAFGLRKRLSPLLNLLLTYTDAIAEFYRRQNVYEFMPRNKALQKIIIDVCTRNRALCLHVVSQVYGETVFTDTKKLGQCASVLMAGTSLKTMLHLTQIYKNKNFTQFDYGQKLNQEKYGSKTPPEYPLEKVTSPIAIFYSDKDVFVDDYSVDRLIERLPNVISKTLIPKYNHIDVLFADTTPTVLYKKIVKLLNKS